jgi:hypothetical protein
VVHHLRPARPSGAPGAKASIFCKCSRNRQSLQSHNGGRLHDFFMDFSTDFVRDLRNNFIRVGQSSRPLIGLRHMPALRVGILMRSWLSGVSLLIKEWVSADPWLRGRTRWTMRRTKN